MQNAALVVAESAEVVNELPFPPVAFGIVAFCGLVALLAITYAFRNAGTRN
ncbi:hypothetical protein SAMN06309944_0570 [Micrococcales bacterium KH10]|nr:hypothetical protein SAMN06309944_0570 [Micrococcales bacterium KH10]